MITISKNKGPFFDKVGILVSTVCLLHCMIVPLLYLIFPFALFPFLSSEWVHLTLASLAVPIAIAAMKMGYSKHGSKRPLYIVLLGMLMLWGALLAHDSPWLETIVAVIGAASIAMAHHLNHTLMGKPR
ncbi:MerC domain-containing protein [Temperatibacter marinus]|uniref:MerC domain-containing protein n=1 Tax=Temperatibacter marinus TaxID=1456591 RepID=A0AA52EGT8_9PROT|nr:MerC domain-containing protein [Temperatibacter marinus]WND01811.1 MerC domain-containing protein [Temperatibacter marinus]